MLRLTRRQFKELSRVMTPSTDKKGTTGLLARKRGQKTRVEIDFEARLRFDWPQMDILYEAVKLRIDETCWYLPDFYIPQLQTFFECKGPYIYPDALIKFKAARALHPWGVFQMHQCKNGVWTRLY